MSAPIPSTLRDLRACKICCLIKTYDQFIRGGCDNCDYFLHMKNNADKVFDCTSANFDGMISLMDPTDSWVAKWQRIGLFLSLKKKDSFFNFFLFFSISIFIL
jgi:transcription elongation factor SPT4